MTVLFPISNHIRLFIRNTHGYGSNAPLEEHYVLTYDDEDR